MDFTKNEASFQIWQDINGIVAKFLILYGIKSIFALTNQQKVHQYRPVIALLNGKHALFCRPTPNC